MIETGSEELSASSGAASVGFRRLRLLDAVGRLGSVRAAARECGVTQPAATQSLAALARNVGFPLFDRHHRGITLTPRGRELHARAADILRKAERSLRRFGVDEPAIALWKVSPLQVRVLDACRQRGGLALAATSLGVHQRSARQALQSIERILARPLLDPANPGELTVAAAELAGQLGLLAAEIVFAIREIADDLDRSARTIVLGVAHDPGTASLDPVIRLHVARQSRNCIEIVEADQHDLLARLAIGEIDLVVGQITGESLEGIVWEELATARHRVAARREHPLVGSERTVMRDLLAASWIFGARGSPRRAASDALFAGVAQPHCAVITSAAPMMAHLLPITDYLAIMTEQEIARRGDTLTALPFELSTPPVRIGLACREGWTPAAEHAETVARVREIGFS